jgi:acetyl esterase/lipase
MNYQKRDLILKYKLFLILFLFVSFISAQPKIYKDVKYGSHPKQKLDIFSSENNNCKPVIIYIHGGFWTDGDKRATYCKDEFFVNNGYVFISVNYRLSGFPNNVNDVAKSIAWVYSNIEKYGGNPNNINLMGFSAGAHLAALVSTDNTYLEHEGLGLNCITNVVLIDGSAYDIPMYIKHYVKPNGIINRQYLDVFKSQANYVKASPINYVSANKNIPNILLIHNDYKNRKHISRNFGAALRLCGIDVIYLNTKEFKHGEMDIYIGNGNHVKYSITILNFIKNGK